MSRRVGAVQASAFLLAGILTGLKFRPPFLPCIILFILSLGASLFFHRRGLKYKLDQPPKKASRILLCAALFAAGMCRTAFRSPEPAPGAIENFISREEVHFTGFLTAPPTVSASRTSIRVQIDGKLSEAGQPDSGKLLLVYYRDPGIEFQYGDRLFISGKAVLPPDSGSGFSYRDYLERDGITAMINNPKAEKISGFSGSRIVFRIYQLRSILLKQVYRLFPKPESALMAGILLGDESGISSEIQHDFQKTGTAHIIAISGANFTLLTWLLLSILRRLIHQWWGPVLMLPVIAFYTILVGGNPAVVRAAIMCGLSIFGSVIGRTGNGINSLAVTAMVMGSFQPAVLLDLGFQLSATATLGILLFAGPLCDLLRSLLSRLFPKLSENALTTTVSAMNDLCILSVSAQIFTVWISARAFGRLSLISLPANFLIAPFQSIIMLGGFAALILSCVFYPVGAAAAWLVYSAPALTIRIVRLCAKARWSSVYFSLSPIRVWMIIGMILALYLGRYYLVRSIRTRNFQPYAALLLLFTAVMVWVNVLDHLDHRTMIRIQQTKTSMVLTIRSPENRLFIAADGLTNYGAREVLEKQFLPVRKVPEAAWIDIQEDWMSREFSSSDAGDGIPVLYLDGKARNAGQKYPEELSSGFEFSADGISLRLAASYLGKRAWTAEQGKQQILFPNGIPPKRIFTREGVRPQEITLVALGKRDDPAVWEAYFDSPDSPVLLDQSSVSEFGLVIDSGKIGIY